MGPEEMTTQLANSKTTTGQGTKQGEGGDANEEKHGIKRGRASCLDPVCLVPAAASVLASLGKVLSSA